MSRVRRVRRNDWSSVTVPDVGAWRPTLTVSVVIPAYNCQAALDLTLASLSRQTYPSALMEVVVVDDGSDPALALPEIKPRNTRLVRVPRTPPGWGPGHAVHHGVRVSTGAVIQRLDADMVVFPDHVEAHARWHHEVPYAVTLGDKRFVDVAPGSASWPFPQTVSTIESMAALFDDEGDAHEYINGYLRRSDQLRDADHLAFMTHVGATVALHRTLYDAAGGLDTQLHLGEDTEFGYRLAQAGAVFIPESSARGWHLGRTAMMRQEEALQRANRPYLADRMPHPRWLRKVGGSVWKVPLVVAVIEVGGHPLEIVRATVDAILSGEEHDVRVDLAGPWSILDDARRSVLADPLLDPRLIEATYRSDPRVRLVDDPPTSAFPAPYLLTLSATTGLVPTAVRRLVDEADRHQAGLVRVVADHGESVVELWRTAALERARLLRRSEEVPVSNESLADIVTDTHGSRTLAAAAVGVVDLSRVPVARLVAGGDMSTLGSPTERWLPPMVEVAGVRTLMRATVLVARTSVGRLRTRARGRLRRGRLR